MNINEPLTQATRCSWDAERPELAIHRPRESYRRFEAYMENQKNAWAGECAPFRRDHRENSTVNRVHPFVERLAAGRHLRIGFYGTSLTADGAWVQQLTDALCARFPGLVTVFNGAESGMHSRWGVENIDTRLLANTPDVVFIEFSVNDACARFGITVTEARTNLETMIDRIQAAHPVCEVILQVMSPVLDRPAGHDGHRPDLAAYQESYRQIGAERGLLVIDHMPAWTALLNRDEAVFRSWVPDGLHPQAEGYARLVTPEILGRLGVRTQRVDETYFIAAAVAPCLQKP